MVVRFLFIVALASTILLSSLPSAEAAAKPFQRCPYCDSSVFEYCSDKLLHDACCCLDPFEHQLPPQCKLADCSFLHANTCRDHHLITRCCCNKVFRF
ncbi:uncharacterized protein [Halyomorpha halys]|uniref:uncharacterized protein n=1 Tax=Halyomorpha halys TaxID=286706 RepID=UPI0006D50B87|nr:uncharacterized protein LOC106692946 [Halyomorpha halys]